MNDELLYRKAAGAAYAVINEWGLRVTYADFQDMRQAAAIGFWRGWQKKASVENEDQRIAYAFGAARNHVKNFCTRTLFGKNPLDRVEFVDETTPCNRAAMAKKELPVAVLGELFQIFMATRVQRGLRSMTAAARDVYIIAAGFRGDSLHAIAVDLGIHYETAKTYRRRARARLRAYIETKEAEEL